MSKSEKRIRRLCAIPPPKDFSWEELVAFVAQQRQLGADGAIEIVWQGRAVKKKVKRDPTLVVQDFAERLDRSAFVVARVSVP